MTDNVKKSTQEARERAEAKQAHLKSLGKRESRGHPERIPLQCGLQREKEREKEKRRVLEREKKKESV